MKTSLPFDVKEKQFDISIEDTHLLLRGRLDMLATTTENELIPVEFKMMSSYKGRPLLDHKYQLALHGVLVERSIGIIVRRGLLHYINDELTIEVILSQNLKTRVLKYVDRIRNLLTSETLPPPRKQCKNGRVGCGFADICQDY